jgi:hypothetical protein
MRIIEIVHLPVSDASAMFVRTMDSIEILACKSASICE